MVPLMYQTKWVKFEQKLLIQVVNDVVASSFGFSQKPIRMLP